MNSSRGIELLQNDTPVGLVSTITAQTHRVRGQAYVLCFAKQSTKRKPDPIRQAIATGYCGVPQYLNTTYTRCSQNRAG
jgi:hypothetical protein